MFGFSIGEILFLGALGLIIVGPKQLPELARNLGRLLNELQRASSGFMTDLRNQADVNIKEPNKPSRPSVMPVVETPLHPADPSAHEDKREPS